MSENRPPEHPEAPNGHNPFEWFRYIAYWLWWLGMNFELERKERRKLMAEIAGAWQELIAEADKAIANLETANKTHEALTTDFGALKTENTALKNQVADAEAARDAYKTRLDRILELTAEHAQTTDPAASTPAPGV